MSNPNPAPSLPDDSQIVKLVEQFQQNYQPGKRLQNEDLVEVDAAKRPKLLFELIVVELELRREEKPGPTMEDYEARFSQYKTIVRKAFAWWQSPKQLGQYKLLEVIAVHGQGVLYRAWHVYMKQEFAVKVLRDDRNGRAAMTRFRREIKELSKVRYHSNIVRAYP